MLAPHHTALVPELWSETAEPEVTSLSNSNKTACDPVGSDDANTPGLAWPGPGKQFCGPLFLVCLCLLLHAWRNV